MRIRTLALAAACALTLAACGGSSSPKPSTTPPSTARPEKYVALKPAQAALLTQKDVGSLFTPATYHSPLVPPYCRDASAPTFANETSSIGLVGTLYGSKNPAATLTEEIYLYRTSAAAQAALVSLQTDMACVTGHQYNPDGTSTLISVGPGVDYSQRLAVDHAYGWTLRTTLLGGMQFGIVVKTTVIVLRYLISPNALSSKDGTSKFPDPFKLATVAISRTGAF
jgi:hypothetical protein